MGLTADEILASLKLPRPPWAHQVEEWVASQDRLERLLWHSMGTGKTVTAIGFLRLKYRQRGAVGKTLVLAPLSTLAGWKAEFTRSSPEAVSSKVVIASGIGKKKMPGAKRAALIAQETSGIVLTNFASLTMPEVVAALRAKEFEYIVIDEIHSFRSHDSKRLAALLKFSDKATVRIGLTGTLVLNGYLDVWAPCRILDKGARFGTNFYSQFRRAYFTDVNAGMPSHSYFPDWQPNSDCVDKISEKLNSLCSRKRKEECLTLPPRVTMREDVELSDEQRKLYSEMEADLITSVVQGTATATNALVKMLRMRQVLSGFISVQDDETAEQLQHYVKANPRLERARELIEAITKDSKLVVWSNFRPMYPKFAELATELKIGFATYTGETKDKEEEKRRFIEDPLCRVMFMNPQAGGTGVDGLQGVCNYCLYYERSHSLEHYQQSRERIHRGGSEIFDKVTEIHLVAPESMLEQDILSSLERKENFSESLLQRLRSIYGVNK